MNNAHTLDRAIGAILGSAAGDALGAPYEFRPSVPDDVPIVFKAGGGWDLGEWTDDTSMAIPILNELAAGHSLEEPEALGRIIAAWLEWSRDAKDVGIQTRQVLGQLNLTTEASARRAARDVHNSTGRSAGNGSLMRTGPVALGYLDDGTNREQSLTQAARRISDLTHFETDAGDACVIWSLAICHAIRTGEYDVRGPIQALPEDRRDRWHALIDVAERTQPRDIPGSNGWVVAALQAAWSAIHHAEQAGEGLVETLERAVRCGNDTDTVAAIAGSLAGARWGASALPFKWRRELHGWPGLDANALASQATLAVAVAIARRAHAGQVDKLGVDYIEHPLTVMSRVTTEPQKIIAILHDVIEDTPVTLQDLISSGFSPLITEAVDAVTKRPGETLEQSMARVAANPLALVVKKADISHNADPQRSQQLPPEKRANLRAKYESSAQLLGTNLDAILAEAQAGPFGQ